MTPDFRGLLVTDDGATILVEWSGFARGGSDGAGARGAVACQQPVWTSPFGGVDNGARRGGVGTQPDRTDERHPPVGVFGSRLLRESKAFDLAVNMAARLQQGDTT